MVSILEVLQVFLSVMVIFLVLMHSGKDSGALRGVRRRHGRRSVRWWIDRREEPESVDDRIAIVYVLNTVAILRLS